MVERSMERDVGLATPVNLIPNEGFDQNSTGDSITSGSSSPLKSDEKVQSRYLSPHMASCHDFCKYGKKHDSEAEARRINFRKLLKKKVPRDQQNEVTVLVPGERRMRTVTKTKDISKLETKFPDNTEVPKPDTPLHMRNSIASGEKKMLQITLEDEQGRLKSLIPGDGKKVKMIRDRTTTLQSKHSPNRPNVNKLEDLSPACDMDTSEEPNIMKTSIASGEKKTLQRTLGNEQGRAKSLNPGDGMKINMIKGGTYVHPPSLLSKASPNWPHVNKFEDLSPVSDMDTSEQPDIIKKNTKSSVKNPTIPSVVSKVIQQKVPPSVSQPAKIKQKVPPSYKRIDGAGKSAITLKTKTPLIRSLSKLKSLRSQIAQRNQENNIMRHLGTSKYAGRELSKPSTASLSSKSSRNLIARRNEDNQIVTRLKTSKLGERKILKPTQAFFSSKTPHDNSLSLQPRKLRSIKRTSMTTASVSSMQLRKIRSIKENPTPHNSVSSLQPRKLRSIKGNSTPHDSASSFQPRKLRSINGATTPHDTVLSLQPTKLRSIKRTSAPQESVPSLKPRKLWNVKPSKPQDSVSILQPRKLRSVERSSSVKDKDKVRKAYTESKSGNGDLDSNPKIEESEPAISEVSDEEIEGNNKVEVANEDENKRPRRTTTAIAPAQPEDHTPAPFKLKFRRGKVINLRSDSIGARRLWFNLGIGKSASDNPNGNGLPGRKNFRRKRVDGTSFDSKDSDSEVHSVVLKHQDVTEKKDAKSLFNHVIEETASKLVETRKSKVKALVGAFETVISLQ